MVYVDFDQRLDALGRVVRGLRARGAAAASGARVWRGCCSTATSPGATPGPTVKARCSSRARWACPTSVARGLDTTGERWDGGGLRRLHGDRLPLAARVSDVADPLELFAWTGGPELARTVLRQRRGRTLDPALVDAALAELPDLLAGPAPRLGVGRLPGGRAGAAAGSGRRRRSRLRGAGTLRRSEERVHADPQRAGRGAGRGGRRAAGLGDGACALLRRAAAVHDLGRVAVATGTWDKMGALNADRVAAGAGPQPPHRGGPAGRGPGRAGRHRRAPSTSAAAAPATTRGWRSTACRSWRGSWPPPTSWRRWASERPHRPALDGDQAARQLRSLVAEGALDARAAQAVLEAAGRRPRASGPGRPGCPIARWR